MSNCKCDIVQTNEKLMQIKALLMELNQDAKDFPALFRNTERALATIKMLELNISDLIEFDLISPEV